MEPAHGHNSLAYGFAAVIPIAVLTVIAHLAAAASIGRDKRLAAAQYAGGDAVSIADFAILGWAWRHERHKVDLADYPNVKRWYEAMMARPGTKRGFEVALS